MVDILIFFNISQLYINNLSRKEWMCKQLSDQVSYQLGVSIEFGEVIPKWKVSGVFRAIVDFRNLIFYVF
jgi:hypothetical protein